METPISLHVLCRKEGHGSKGLEQVRVRSGEYRSTSWRVPKKFGPDLRGKPFAMHEAKGETSYFGGIIKEIEFEEIPDNNNEERAVVIFIASRDGIGLKWPPTNNPNEYHKVNTTVPLEKLRK